MLRKYIAVSNGEIQKDDIDHYMNKRIKMSGDLQNTHTWDRINGNIQWYDKAEKGDN